MNMLRRERHIYHGYFFANALWFLTLTGLLFFTGCANIVTPSGGDKDTDSPKVVEIVPENQSRNFTARSFTITFNEYVQLNDISTQLIVSPPLKTPPEFVIKGRSIIVKFKEELLPNTTYTMNFGSAIRDINENNPLEGFTYVFSTGSFIDSLSFAGTVRNALTLENEKGVLVLLYDEDVDSLPYLKQPYYYAKTEESGNFKLDNLKAGKYKVVALKDENSSFLYDDFDKEKIGFLDTLVSPRYIEGAKKAVNDSLTNDSIKAVKKDTLNKAKPDTLAAVKGGAKVPDGSVVLYVFQELKSKQYLKKGFAEYYGKLVFVFNKKPERLVINPLNTTFKKEWNIMEHSVTGDSVTLWLSDVVMDTLNLEVTDDGVVLDTVELALKKRTDKIESQSGSGKQVTRQTKRFELTVESPKASTLNPAKGFAVTFNHPVKNCEAEKFVLKEGEDTVKFSLDSKDPALRKFNILYKWKPDKKYKLFIPAGTVTDIFDLKNDSVTISITSQPKDYFGNVSFIIKGKGPGYILQLTDDKNNIVAEKVMTGNEGFRFEGLEPKSYGLRLVNDANGNGKWDTGNYLQKKQAEKIIPYPQKVNVRSNWDVDVEWEVIPLRNTN